MEASHKLLTAEQALLDVLSQDAELNGMVTGIYARIPSAAEPPYLGLEAGETLPVHSMPEQGESVTVSLRAVSAGEGLDELNAILEAVERLLSNCTVPIAGYGEGICRHLTSSITHTQENHQMSWTVRLTVSS